MDIQRFKQIYGESRNGANEFYRHPLLRALIYSDGVKELAELGCYWLLDIIGTEVIDFMRQDPVRGWAGHVVVKVLADSKAEITLTYSDDQPAAWLRKLDFTTMPEGTWTFLIANDDGQGKQYSLILPMEY